MFQIGWRKSTTSRSDLRSGTDIGPNLVSKTTFPKLKTLINTEFWWRTIGWSPEQRLINAKEEKVLYEVWKKELGLLG
jgi:hypothetical protein